jgi:hypothetical protein
VLTKYLHIQSAEQCLESSELLTPHPLSSQRVCPPPAPKTGGGVNTRRAVRGWGVNISEDVRHWFGLLQFNPFTVVLYESTRIIGAAQREKSTLLTIKYVYIQYLEFHKCLSHRPNWDPLTPSLASECASEPQSRQSAKRFSSCWNWDSPTPLAAGECAPPPTLWSGGEGTLACG